MDLTLRSCPPAVTPVCVVSGIGGAVIPGSPLAKALSGLVIAAVGQSECIRPLRAFGVGLVVGSAAQTVVSLLK